MHKQKISLIPESGFSNIEWVINKESQESSSVNRGLVDAVTNPPKRGAVAFGVTVYHSRIPLISTP